MSQDDKSQNREGSVTLVENGDGWTVFLHRQNAVTVLDRATATELCRQLASALKVKPEPITVHFSGGPWNGQTHEVERVVAPVFAVGHEIGNHYWLDTKSDPPTYFWDKS